MKRSDKKKIQYSLIVFTLIVVLVFFLTIPLKQKTDDSFIIQVQTILDMYAEQTYTVESPVTVQSTLSTTAHFYSVKTRNNTTHYACIMRIMGLSGPVPTVFLFENNKATMIGYPGFGDNELKANHGLSNNQIAYWEKSITDVLTEYTSQGDTE